MKNSINLILSLFTLLFFLGCNQNSSTDYSSSSSYEESRPLTEAELKQMLLDKECLSAPEYLVGTLKQVPKYKHALSLKVKALKLTCDIKNNATLATFKDIKARVRFESKTGAEILTKEFDIYEFIEPNGTFIYKTEIGISNQQYKDISTFSWEILSASCK
jgi:hypothetical protein|tara:strand:+ start:180 stop:662 length:483 start_codon:yes stop_codon:yes gene_type:complete